MCGQPNIPAPPPRPMPPPPPEKPKKKERVDRSRGRAAATILTGGQGVQDKNQQKKPLLGG